MRNQYVRKTPQQHQMEEQEMYNNPETRVPIVFCVDRSYSMCQEKRLEKVMEGMEVFRGEMLQYSIARDAVEVAIISYGGEYAKEECDFTPIERLVFPKLTPCGQTPLVSGVKLALDMLARRKVRYQNNGTSFYRLWIIFIGDGDDTYSDKALDEVAAVLKRESDEKRVSVLCVTVGDPKQREDLSI